MQTKGKVQNKTVGLIKKLANYSLRIDANNTSSLFVYQPKAPAALKKLSKINKE